VRFRHDEETTGQQGFSLLVVLLTILAIAAILTPLALSAKTRALFSATLLRSDQLDFLADGVATILASQYVADIDQTGAGVRMNSTLYKCRTGGLTIAYTLQRHDGLINLNLAPEALLAVAFRSLGFRAQTAQAFAETVVAYRSSKDGIVSGSALEIKDGLKNASFESISELYDFEPFRTVPLRKLSRVFTVNSLSAGITLTNAPDDLRNRIATAEDLSAFVQQPGSSNAGAVGVSVSISDEKASGQFNGIFDAHGAAGRRPVILASWHYDVLDEPGTIVDEGDCRNRFGTAFEMTVAEMR